MLISKVISYRHSQRTKALRNTKSGLRTATLLLLFEASVVFFFISANVVKCVLLIGLYKLDLSSDSVDFTNVFSFSFWITIETWMPVGVLQ